MSGVSTPGDDQNDAEYRLHVAVTNYVFEYNRSGFSRDDDYRAAVRAIHDAASVVERRHPTTPQTQKETAMNLRLEPNEPCVVYRGTRNSNGTANIKPDIIVRVLKRDVVTAGGERFNRDRLSRSNGAWETPTELLSRDDPKVLRARAANARQALIRKIRDATDAANDCLRTGNIDAALAILRDISSPTTESTNQP